MKTTIVHIRLVVLLLLFSSPNLFAQVVPGRVVINEYLPWPSNACGNTSEFVELLNFGPGPMDIGCYILSNGKYSITIPPNTVLAPGQFYVISGQSILPTGCGNKDSSIHVNLNWNTCNCTNTAIPTTGDGFMTDGGGGNVNLVLLNPNLNVVDAVTRALPVDASTTITTSGLANACSSKTYNLNSLTINYETLGMSTGNANSFARKMDGDCGWVKTPSQSANATNNSSTNTASVQYDFTLTGAMDCGTTGGSVHVTVTSSDYASIYPMNYTLALDSNNNGSFDLNDLYTYGTASTPPNIDIGNLKAGHYKLTIASAKGCDLKTFDFTILSCYPVLPVKLVSFRLAKSINQTQTFSWSLNDVENLSSMLMEKSADGIYFSIAATIQDLHSSGTKFYTTNVPAETDYKYYRLKIYNKDGSYFYSPVLNIFDKNNYTVNRIYPNPANDKLFLDLVSEKNTAARYKIVNANGAVLKQGSLDLHLGLNTIPMPLQGLPNGYYQLLVTKTNEMQPISFRFVKQ